MRGRERPSGRLEILPPGLTQTAAICDCLFRYLGQVVICILIDRPARFIHLARQPLPARSGLRSHRPVLV